jgi:hypothetical protein
MNLNNLKQFLIESNNAGYASGESKKLVKESDGSTTIPFKKGPWKSHDNFFGGEPYGGRTVVFFKNKPVWLMAYYGWITEGVENASVYKTLQGALKQMPPNYPYRGPKEFKENEFVYINSRTGEIDRFSGEEQITQNGKLVYKANYFGGLVDQRKEA